MDTNQLFEIYKTHPVVTTDSRNCPQGSIFIALKGVTFDGNKFALQALDKGCSWAVVDDKQVYEQAKSMGRQVMLVPDTLQAFKDLAREHRRQFNIPIVAITGTNGKTTTKELVRAVLQQRYNVMATEGNFNNDVGVPKTLLRLNATHELAIVEMGASHPGDIKTLAETAEPTCGLITNVGKAHLQGFGSFQGVIATKGELYDYLATAGGNTIFANVDNPHLMSILPTSVDHVLYSHNDHHQAQVLGRLMACDPFLRLQWRKDGDTVWHEVATHLIGSYNIDNVLAAITVGLYFAVSPEQICDAIANYVPSNNRSQLTQTENNHLIVDAYNANPTSMAAALENFRLMQVKHKMAIIGEMRELGDSSASEHRTLVELLKECNFEMVWLVGHEFDDISCDFPKYADVEQVKQAIAEQLPHGYYILIKGSNGNCLYQLPDHL